LKNRGHTAATLAHKEIVSAHLQNIEKFLTLLGIKTAAEKHLVLVRVGALIAHEKSQHSRGTFLTHPGPLRKSAMRHESQTSIRDFFHVNSQHEHTGTYSPVTVRRPIATKAGIWFE
jgi:hypothetical protein